VPELRARVNDHAKLLSIPEVNALEAKLAAHEKATGQQFALLTWQDLRGVKVEDFGYTVANHWRLGRAEHDDGLLLVVAVNQRQVDLELGKGLESAISSELSRSVVHDLSPAFRAEQYAAGLDKAFDQLIAAATPAKPKPR
jgi:uncharacterized protein